MTESEALDWLAARYDAGQVRLLETYATLLRNEAKRQNLIARSTLNDMWTRHIVDSAQLIALVKAREGIWVDIGSGAGLPGIVVAILSNFRTVLMEPRRLRAEFLRHCADQLGISDRVNIIQSKAESASPGLHADIISARAVANTAVILAASQHFSKRSTLWVLPKGQSVESEVADVVRSWQGRFHVERSVVDSASGIIVAEGVRPR